MKSGWFLLIAALFGLFSSTFISFAFSQDRLMGLVTIEQVLEHDPEYRDRMIVYEPDADAVKTIAEYGKPLLIKLFYRNDCPDSIREVPRLLKTLQVADNENITLEIIGINYNKDEPADLLNGWDIEYVPTVIVLSEDKEIGRIVEDPIMTMEQDLASLLIN